MSKNVKDPGPEDMPADVSGGNWQRGKFAKVAETGQMIVWVDGKPELWTIKHPNAKPKDG